MQGIRVSDNKRCFCTQDGMPFFLLGDTAWEMLYTLSKQEIEEYLHIRAEQGFNAILVTAIWETEQSIEGYTPFERREDGRMDPTKPVCGEKSFWNKLDYTVQKAYENNIYVGIVISWGDRINKMPYGKCNEIFERENSYLYARWIGERYKDNPNIFWVLGGDRPLITERHFACIHAMADGLREADDNCHMVTFHPPGKSSSSYHFPDEPFLDFHMLQSSHSVWDMPNYNMIREDLELPSLKPVIDGEPCYEDHPFFFEAKNGYFDEVNVRKAAYWSVFSGAAGHIYGHNCVWHMVTAPDEYYLMTWREALKRPGCLQMRYIKELVESLPNPNERISFDQSLAVNFEGSNHQVALKSGDVLLVYSPNGLNITLNLKNLGWNKVSARFFNPRTGQYAQPEISQVTSQMVFYTPAKGRSEDIVLRVEKVE